MKRTTDQSGKPRSATRLANCIMKVWTCISSAVMSRPEKKLKEQKMAAAQKKRIETDSISKAKNRYKNVLALYKAKRYIEAREQLQLLRNFLQKYALPENFYKDMTQKAQAAEGSIEKGE